MTAPFFTFLILGFAVTTAALLAALFILKHQLSEIRRRIQVLEGQVAAREGLENRGASSTVAEDLSHGDFPQCRITLQDAGPTPSRITDLLVEHLGVTGETAGALVGLGHTEIPIPNMGPQEAYRLRTALSEAGAIVSLFMRRVDEDEPHPDRPDKTTS